MKAQQKHLSRSSFSKHIDLIERYAYDFDSLLIFLKLINDPIEREVFSGLLKIKQDIGDKSLHEHLQKKQEHITNLLSR